MKKPDKDSVGKEKWEKPAIKSLKFRKTQGGQTSNEAEGIPWDGSIY